MIDEIISKKIIPRKSYTNKIISSIWKPVIKVIIWPRRVGKSFLMQYTIQHIVKNKLTTKENILYINKEFIEWQFIQNHLDLQKYLSDRFGQTYPKHSKMIFIDEVQDIVWREKTINWLLAKYHSDIDIFLSGSNTTLLSGDLSTLIAGRYVVFQVYPLSLSEFSFFIGKDINQELLLEYLKYGGMPGIFSFYESKELLWEYLKNIYNTTILKDIIKYYQIRNIDFFEKLLMYVFKNNASIFSAKSITGYLKSQLIKSSVDSVIQYLWYWEKAFLLQKVSSYQPNTKKFFDIYNKYYTIDLGIRNAIVGYQWARDMSYLLENYVFLELLKKWYQINIGRIDDKEIDFVWHKDGKIIYLQVAWWLMDESVVQREYSSLSQIQDNRPKYVVSMDDIGLWVKDGIQHIKAWELENIL